MVIIMFGMMMMKKNDKSSSITTTTTMTGGAVVRMKMSMMNRVLLVNRRESVPVPTVANAAIRKRYVSARDVRRYVTAHVTARKVTGHVTRPPAKSPNAVSIQVMMYLLTLIVSVFGLAARR